MKKYIKTAEVLIECLPYMREFYNKAIVIKYGGNVMVDEVLKAKFAEDITLLKYAGIHPVIIHGGGPQIKEYLEKLNIKTKFIDGMRVTDFATMDVAEMVLAGKVNKNIVSLINSKGGNAVGISGKDGKLIQAKKLKIVRKSSFKPPEIIDIGLVGKIVKINADIIKILTDHKFIPVIAPVGVGKKNETFNINADIVTGAIAAELKAYKVIYLTDTSGVMKKGKLLSSIKFREVPELKRKRIISGGMIPKIDSCVQALKNGVKSAHIIDGRVKHSILLEIFTDAGIGTMIKK